MPASADSWTMKLIVGLGNPGREYANTRHNVGFRVVDELAKKGGLRFDHRRAHAQIASGQIAGADVLLAKPQTMMNLSGDAVRGLLQWLSVEPSDLLVVYDDLDLPFGKIRLRERGSAGGHRGVQSIIDRLGTDAFARLKVGVGRPEPLDAVEYVLSPFAPEEQSELPGVLDRAVAAVESYLAEGLQMAMSRHNR